MPQWTIISRQHHASARYQPRSGFVHAKEQIITPVLLTELPKLISRRLDRHSISVLFPYTFSFLFPFAQCHVMVNPMPDSGRNDLILRS